MSDKEDPRVLVVSHNALHPGGNMGRTLSGLLRSWDRAAVAQIYFRQELPDPAAADRFWRVTEFDLFRGGGSAIGPNSAEATERQKRVYARGRARRPLTDGIRELMWLAGRWYTPGLKGWLAEFDPQVILFAGGGYCFAYRAARKLGRSLGIPVVPYFCDDYYHLDRGWASPLYRLLRRTLRRQIMLMARQAPVCLAISREMAEDYSRQFGVPFDICMTGAARRAERPISGREYTTESPFRLCYAGRLGLGRAETLAGLGREITRIGLPMVVEVWTDETDPALIGPLRRGDGIRLMGRLAAETVWDRLAVSDGVLHVESHDPAMMGRTRYSVSSKLPDLLSCGACPVVCGPKGLASVEHPGRHGAALVLHSPAEAEKLAGLLRDDLRREITGRALTLAERCHDGGENSRRLKKLLGAVCRGEEVRL